MSPIVQDIVKTALAEMSRKGYFDICTVDKVLRLTGGVPDGDDYRALSLLHCVSFKDFPQRLRLEFPMLLKRVLESPGMEIEVKFAAVSRPSDIFHMLIDGKP